MTGNTSVWLLIHCGTCEQRLVNHVSRQLGLPQSTRAFRKFLLHAVPEELPHHETFEVNKVSVRLPR